jgi:hypothetical protein
VPVHVRISRPWLLDELMAELLRNRCVALRLGRDACAVVHVDAVNPDEAEREIAFFIGAWTLRHPGVSTTISA